MNLSIFADKLSELIFDSKLDAVTTAKEIGISKTSLYEYLSGNKMPTLANIIKICDYYNCSIDYLLGRESETQGLTYKPSKPFPVCLQTFLDRYGISRYKLEQITGISESTLFYWAKGVSTPTLEKLSLIAEKFDCSIDSILGRV